MDNQEREAYVSGRVVEGPEVATFEGGQVARSVLDCGGGRKVEVSAPVAKVESEAGRVVAGVGAGLLRYGPGEDVVVLGQLRFGPVRVSARRIAGSRGARPLASLPLGSFRFVGYRPARGMGMPEVDIELPGGQRLRALLPKNLYVQPGSWLSASIAWSRRRAWRAPYRLVGVSIARPPEMAGAEAA